MIEQWYRYALLCWKNDFELWTHAEQNSKTVRWLELVALNFAKWLLKSSCAGKFVGHAEKSMTDSKSLPNYDVNQPRYGS